VRLLLFVVPVVLVAVAWLAVQWVRASERAHRRALPSRVQSDMAFLLVRGLEDPTVMMTEAWRDEARSLIERHKETT
jgi:uncharacterized protein YcaQ